MILHPDGTVRVIALDGKGEILKGYNGQPIRLSISKERYNNTPQNWKLLTENEREI